MEEAAIREVEGVLPTNGVLGRSFTMANRDFPTNLLEFGLVGAQTSSAEDFAPMWLPTIVSARITDTTAGLADLRSNKAVKTDMLHDDDLEVHEVGLA